MPQLKTPRAAAKTEDHTRGASVSHSVVSHSLQPYGLWPTRLLCLWDSSGKNTGLGCHFLLQGNLPNSGIEHTFPALSGGFFTTAVS